MRGYNKVIIAGNLVRDPDLRYTVNQRAFLRFTVAVGYRYKTQNGEYQEGTDFIGVVAWGNTGESVAKYIKKGSPVLVEGRIRTGSYEKDGVKRYTTDVLAESIMLLGGTGQGDYNNNNNNNSAANNRNNNVNISDPSVYRSSMPGGDFETMDFSQGFSNGGFPGSGSVNNSGFVEDNESESDIPF